MPGSVLRALIDAAQPAGWVVAISLFITGIGLIVKNADRPRLCSSKATRC